MSYINNDDNEFKGIPPLIDMNQTSSVAVNRYDASCIHEFFLDPDGRLAVNNIEICMDFSAVLQNQPIHESDEDINRRLANLNRWLAAENKRKERMLEFAPTVAGEGAVNGIGICQKE